MPQPHLHPQCRFAPPMVAAALVFSLGGCEAQRAFIGYEAPESPGVEAAAWPRLADGPTHAEPPGPGPDPATGAAITVGLTADARGMAARAEALAEPVVPVDELLAEGERTRAGR